jgi:PAS domain S-box-containing protein
MTANEPEYFTRGSEELGYATASMALAMVESSEDAMIGKTPEGVITSWNPAAAWLYGYSAKEILGKSAAMLFPPHRVQEEAELLSRIAAGEHIPDYQTERVGADGTIIRALLSMSPILDATGNLVGVASASRGLDERARTGERLRLEAQTVEDRQEDQAQQEGIEAQLRQAQRLESLGLLAGGVAHDFNNLLAATLNYATFVAEEITAAHAQGCDHLVDAGHDVQEIVRAAKRGTDLTRQLLAFGRREVIRAEVLDLNEVILNVSELLQRTLGEGIKLSLLLTENPNPVLADAGQLERVLLNLTVNALAAMPAGGTLSIDTSNVAGTATAANSSIGTTKVVAGSNQIMQLSSSALRLRVTDTGTGIPAEVVDHVFEPFFTTKDLGSGTGLGLATVYGIVTQAGGTIQVHSRPGAGTTFTILLPLTTEKPVKLVELVPYERSPKGETVLVVEDEQSLREVTRRIFTRNGFQVLTAANGPEALEIARGYAGDIHLLLTDVVMPGMLGKEVAEKMQTILPEVHVLYMSGYAQPVLASQGRLDPGVVLLEKPFTEADLLKRAGQVLNGGFKGFQTAGSTTPSSHA